MRSVGLSDPDSYELTADIRSSGEMGDRNAKYLDLEKINFDGLAAVTIEALCSCAGSNSDATDKALHSLNAVDVNKCRSLAQLLAMELSLWQACYRELGDPPMATYLRLNNLKAACARDYIWCDLITAFNEITLERQKHQASEGQIMELHRIEALRGMGLGMQPGTVAAIY